MLIDPAALTTASTVAVVPTPADGADTVIVGAVVYPEPPEVIVTIPMVLSPINAVPAAPDPPEPLI